jgi:hypothetical protein
MNCRPAHPEFQLSVTPSFDDDSNRLSSMHFRMPAVRMAHEGQPDAAAISISKNPDTIMPLISLQFMHFPSLSLVWGFGVSNPTLVKTESHFVLRPMAMSAARKIELFSSDQSLSSESEPDASACWYWR